MFRSPIFRRIFAVSLGVIAIAVISIVSVLSKGFNDRLHLEAENILKSEIRSMEKSLAYVTTSDAIPINYIESISKISDNRVTLIDDEGVVLFDSARDAKSMTNHADRPEIMQARANKWGSVERFSHTTQKNYLYMAKHVLFQDQTFFIRSARPHILMNRELQNMIWVLFTLGVFIVSASAVVLYFSIRGPLQRIAYVTSAAKQMAGGEYHVRINTKASIQDEVALLSNTMNHLSETIETQILSLQDSEKKLFDILTNLKDGLVVIDQHDEIVLSNHAWRSIYNLEVLEQGKRFFEYVRHPTLSKMIEYTRATANKAQEVIDIEHLEQIDTFNVQAFTIELKKETLTVLTMSNISDITRAEKLKRDFIANASHQLKTPLSAIQGYAETLMDVQDISKEKKTTYLQKIVERSSMVTDMIVRLLTLTKIQDEYSDAAAEKVELSTLIEHVFEQHEVELSQKSIMYHVELDDQDCCIVTVPHLLEMALGALVENAIQYSPEHSSITVKVTSSSKDVEIMIQDQGIGFEHEEKEHIFERFYRAERAHEMYAHGTGIGLALVDLCMKRLDGHVQAQSHEKKGACFVMILPKDIRKNFTDSSQAGSKDQA